MRTSFRRAAFTVAAAMTAVIVTSPAWAAFPNQGNRILYVRAPYEATGTPSVAPRGTVTGADLFSIRNNGDDRRRVSDSGKVNEFGGYFSPDGDHIVFWGQTADGYQVFRADADGTHRKALTTNPVSVQPNWSRNGKQIVYAKFPATAKPQRGGPLTGRRGPASGHLMLMDADGSAKHSILDAPVYSPGWSPTRAEIAYSSQIEGGGVGIFLIPPDGGKPTLVCCKGGTAVFADWSPDGSRLLFLYAPPAGSGIEVWTVRRNGTDPVPVTNESYSITLPRYTDDGERVVFAKDPGGGALDLYSIRSDGSGGKKRLTDTPKFHEWLNLFIG
jgi:Tol biopolymer transport system component